MPEQFFPSAAVRFIDRSAVLGDLRLAVAEARAARPEIGRVFLFGSFARGDWTAAGDADLMVVVDREFEDILDRSPYQIYTKAIQTDSLVYSRREFEQMAQDPESFVARNLAAAIEL